MCMLQGVPSELIEVTQGISRKENSVTLRINNRILTYMTVTKAIDDWPILEESLTPSDPSVDIFLDYPDEEVVLEGYGAFRPPVPVGMSGGPLWDMGHTTGLWTPADCKLIGIQHEWSSSQRWLRVVQIYHWLKLIQLHYPDLRNVLESRFPELSIAN